MKNRVSLLLDNAAEVYAILKSSINRFNNMIECALFGDDTPQEWKEEYDTSNCEMFTPLLEDNGPDYQQCSITGRRGTCYDLILKNAREEIRKGELYLQSITLNELSKLIYSNRNYLSYSIRTIEGVSYKQFINAFRFEHARMLFEKDREISLQDIAILSGFTSSKSFQNALNRNSSPSLIPLKKRYLCRK